MRLRKGRRLKDATIDDIDEQIISILRENGRATNQEIADRLSITAATVSARLGKMEEGRAMKVMAVADFSAHGYDMLVPAGIKVIGRPVTEVAQALSVLPEIFSLHIMRGRYDIEILALFQGFDSIHPFFSEVVARIPGVSEISPGIAADVAKFEFNVAPL